MTQADPAPVAGHGAGWMGAPIEAMFDHASAAAAILGAGGGSIFALPTVCF